MRHPIKLIVRGAKVSKNGITPIALQYCFSAEKRVVLSTGISIPIHFWNKKTGRLSKDLPPDYGNVQELETTLPKSSAKPKIW